MTCQVSFLTNLFEKSSKKPVIVELSYGYHIHVEFASVDKLVIKGRIHKLIKLFLDSSTIRSAFVTSRGLI